MGLALDEPQKTDQIEIINGIHVAIDQRVVPQTEGLTLDFQETAQGPGLVLLGLDSCC